MGRIPVLLNLFILISLISAISTPSATVFANGRPEAGLSGIWHTTWTIMEYGVMKTYEFDMQMAQSGSQVRGTGSAYGWSMTGTLSGNSLTGTWSATGLAANAPHVNGQFQITLASSGNSFSGLFKGQYHYDLWDPRFIVAGTKTGSGTTPYTPPNVQPTPSPTPTPAPSPKPAIRSCDFTGLWDTDYGDLQITQTGNVITGTYSYQEGRIHGTVMGNVATGTWSESPSFQPPLDAGDFTFVLSDNCKSFTGQWRYGSCDWDGDINGIRIFDPTPTPAPTPEPTPFYLWFAGTWQTTWGEMVLTQSGSQVSGTYTHDNGKITGTASGNTFSGWWSEAPTYSPDNDAGGVELTVSADGKTISGRWRYGTSGKWYENNWEGKRTSGLPKTSEGTGLNDNPTVTYNQNWTGKWDTDWGEMQLTQSVTSVRGTYTYKEGEIEGNSSGNILYGTWSKSPSYSAPKDAGALELEMSPTGDKFTGSWKYSSCPWEGDWDGVLSEDEPAPSPTPVPQNNNPIASFFITPQTPQAGDVLVASGQCSDPDGDALLYSWFLDGTQQNACTNQPYCIIVNASSGTHIVGLQITDGRGGNAFLQKKINVSQSPSPQPTPGINHLPIAYIYTSPQSPTSLDTIVATCQASDEDGDTLIYSWYKDGVQAAEYNNLTYMLWMNPSPGTHIISLQVSDGKGEVTPVQQQISVSQGTSPSPAPTPGANTAPKAYFKIAPPQPQAGEDITVNSQTTDADGDTLSLTWSIDGQAMNQYAGKTSWTWLKPDPGGHVLQLGVNDGKGGSDTFARRVRIPSDGDKDADKDKWKIGPFSCFIATAAYGSETAKELDTLRMFRDKVLLQSLPGKLFVYIYYRISPPFAEFIAGHEKVRTFVREKLLDPLVILLKNTEAYWNRQN